MGVVRLFENGVMQYVGPPDSIEASFAALKLVLSTILTSACAAQFLKTFSEMSGDEILIAIKADADGGRRVLDFTEDTDS